jgi:cytochrome b561
MRITNTLERYGALHQLLHWGAAGLIVVALYLGLTETSIGLHKSLGATILMLTIFRFIWRKLNTQPLLPTTMTTQQKILAENAHFVLYALMLIMPLSGWVMSNAAGYPVSVFGMFDLPTLVAKDKELRHLAGDIHEIGGFVLLGMIGLHFAAALYHQFVLKDGLMWRMIPCSSKRVATLNLTETEKKTVEKAPWA